MFPKDITKWSSNDLMDKIEGPEPEDTQGNRPGYCRAWGWLQGAKPPFLTQLLCSAGPGRGGVREWSERHPGPRLLPAQPLCGGPGAAQQPPSSRAPHFYVTDGLYRQSTPEFRVASSVERLNIIEVGARGRGPGAVLPPPLPRAAGEGFQGRSRGAAEAFAPTASPTSTVAQAPHPLRCP